MTNGPEYIREKYLTDARDELIYRARLGEITPGEAESEARRLGLPPFEEEPKPSEHDPQHKSRWSLAMVLAWIVWRDFEEVRQWDNAFRADCYRWEQRVVRLPNPDGSVGKSMRGWFIEQTPPTTALMFEAWGHLTDEDNVRLTTGYTPLMAKTELWTRLQDAELEAEAIPATGGARIVIPSHEWVDLQNMRGRNDGDEYLRHRHHRLGRAYVDVLYRRAEVMRLWPVFDAGQTNTASTVFEPSKPPTREATAKDALALEAWVDSVLATGGPPPTRKQAEVWAKEHRLSMIWVRGAHSNLPNTKKLGRGQTPENWLKRAKSSEK